MSSSLAGSPHPYIPATEADRARMLERVGVADLDALFADLPADLRDPAIELPSALTEPELIALLSERAADNAAPTRPSFLGAGAYRRSIPAIASHLTSRSEFVTAYTPYQPEISQGTLQSGFEFQSVVCELTGMDVANVGLYDVASATAEACLLAVRVTKRRAVALLEPIHPGTAEVVSTYARGASLRVDPIASADAVSEEHACLVVQQPDFLGTIVDLEPLANVAHDRGALMVAVADPFALGMLKAPGDAGADIVTGEGRDLAGAPAFGGPSLGLFAAGLPYMRQMPGRIVGRTNELHGPEGGEGEPRTGYVLTLQAREQFIRRERATSNVSTAQALIALSFTMPSRRSVHAVCEHRRSSVTSAHTPPPDVSPDCPGLMSPSVAHGSRNSSCVDRFPHRNSPLDCPNEESPPASMSLIVLSLRLTMRSCSASLRPRRMRTLTP